VWFNTVRNSILHRQFGYYVDGEPIDRPSPLARPHGPARPGSLGQVQHWHRYRPAAATSMGWMDWWKDGGRESDVKPCNRSRSNLTQMRYIVAAVAELISRAIGFTSSSLAAGLLNSNLAVYDPKKTLPSLRVMRRANSWRAQQATSSASFRCSNLQLA